MTDYHYDESLVWANLANFVRQAAGIRSVAIIDPATGTPPALTQSGVTVLYVTADARGLATFTATSDTVIADFGAGPLVLYSAEKIAATSSGTMTVLDGGLL